MLPWMHTNSQNYVRWPRLAILGPSHQFSGAGVLMARRGVGVCKVAPPSERSELSRLSRPLLSYLVYLDYLSYLDGAIWTIWSYLEMHTFGGQCAYREWGRRQCTTAELQLLNCTNTCVL